MNTRSKLFGLILLSICVIVTSVYFVLYNNKEGREGEQSVSPASIPLSHLPTSFSTTSMKLTSDDFQDNGNIPQEFTCDGNGVNPNLHIANVPKDARSLVLIMEDPDVPTTLRADGMFDHWVLYNIDPTTTTIEKGSTLGAQGMNTRGTTSYVGPCPPDREHRYFFKLFAVDTIFQFIKAPKKQEILTAIKGHIISEATLMGHYERTHQ